MKTALVVHGPSVWVDRRGEVVSDEGEFVVVRILSKDDAGDSSYDIRFPKECLKFVDAVAQA